MNFKSLQAKVKKKATEHQVLSYTLLTLMAILVMQRLDRLAFWDLGLADLWNTDRAYVYTFWTLLGLLTILWTLTNYVIASFFSKGRVHKVLSMMMPWFIWAGVLDIFYLVDIPLPGWLFDPNYIWIWHIVYMLTGFPWNIIHQIFWTSAWLLGYYLLYKWATRK